jgi:hypothetical protein
MIVSAVFLIIIDIRIKLVGQIIVTVIGRTNYEHYRVLIESSDAKLGLEVKLIVVFVDCFVSCRI